VIGIEDVPAAGVGRAAGDLALIAATFDGVAAGALRRPIIAVLKLVRPKRTAHTATSRS
jgi:hypothetical protein